MKLIPIYFTIIFSLNAYALADLEQDHILVYQNSEGGTLVNNLIIYDNKELKGSPSFILEKDKLIIGSKVFPLKIPVSCKDLNVITRNCNVNDIPVDFLKVQSRDIYLLVEQKTDDLVKIRNRDISYYLKLKKTDFKKLDWPEGSQWRLILGEKAKLQLKVMMSDNIALIEVFKSLRSCVKLRDKKCLTALETKDVHSDKMFKYRSIADDPILCKKFLNIWGDNFEDDMEYILKDNPVADSETTWKNLDELLNLDNSTVQVGLGTSKFLGVDDIALTLKSSSVLKCENEVDLQISIKEVLNNITGKKEWKINYFSTYSRKDDRN